MGQLRIRRFNPGHAKVIPAGRHQGGFAAVKHGDGRAGMRLWVSLNREVYLACSVAPKPRAGKSRAPPRVARDASTRSIAPQRNSGEMMGFRQSDQAPTSNQNAPVWMALFPEHAIVREVLPQPISHGGLGGLIPG